MPPYLYLQQLARAWRFRDRYAQLLAGQPLLAGDEFNDIEDFMIATMHFVWHLKDWIYNDPLLDVAQRKRIVGLAEKSRELLIVADMANGTKHVVVSNSRTGGRDVAIELQTLFNGKVVVHHIIADNSGARQKAIDVIDSALNRWQALLDAEGLPTYADGPPAA